MEQIRKMVRKNVTTKRLTDQFYVDGDVNVPDARKDISRVIYSQGRLRIDEMKPMENYMRITGRVLYQILYVTEEGDRSLSSLQGKLLFDEMLYTEDAKGTPVLRGSGVELEVTVIHPRKVNLKALVEMEFAAEERLDVLADLYSLEETLVPETEEVTASGLVMVKLARHQLTEQLRVPELGSDVLQVCHSGGRLTVEHTEITADGIRAEGVLHMCVLYVKADDEMPFAVWQGMVPFTCVVECGQVSEEMEYDMTGLLEQLSVEIQGDGRAEVRAAIGFRLFLRKPETFRNIREIRVLPVDRKEREKEPGIVGYTVREGDELWELAKRYHTTTEGILRANGLETDTPGVGEKLLIFRGNMGIL